MKRIKMVRIGLVGGYDFGGEGVRSIPLLGYTGGNLAPEAEDFFAGLEIGAPVRVAVTVEALADLVEVDDAAQGL